MDTKGEEQGVERVAEGAFILKSALWHCSNAFESLISLMDGASCHPFILRPVLYFQGWAVAGS